MMKKLNLTILLFFVTQAVGASNWANRGGHITDISKNKRASAWKKLGKDNKTSLIELINIIESSPLGKKLISKAKQKAFKTNQSILDVIKEGEVSVTDTTLIRRFSISNPQKVEYEAKSIVYLDSSHSVKNAVLDLVHELTHYIYKKPFNPYKSKFSITQFMKDTIEGPGGEVDAFVIECKVGEDIYGKYNVSSQCRKIRNESGNFSKKLAMFEFYKLGNSFEEFVDNAKRHKLHLDRLKYISRENGLLVSSAWGSPYPLAVLEEYTTIMGKVCDNDRKRLSYFDEQYGRQPASKKPLFEQMRNRLNTRCKSF